MNAAEIMQICPTEETLAAFLDGSLDEQARLEVIEHLADCGECLDMVMAADEYRSTLEVVEPVPIPAPPPISAPQPAQPAAVVHGRFGRRVFAPLAAAAALVAVLFGVPSIREAILGGGSLMPELVEAANKLPERPAAARLSGDFAYKRHSTPRGGSEDESDLNVQMTAYKAEDRATKNPTPENLHALGVADVLMMNRNDAVSNLERAAKASPGSADILTDLSAAYIARGADELAYATATKAYSIQPTPAAAWNIAMALEHQQKDAEAIAAWQKYLALDPNSEWSAEAKRYLEDLKSR